MPKVNIDGEEFDISAEALQGILDAIDATVGQGVEHGFYFCDQDGVLVPGEKCVGTQCSIALHDCKGLPIAGEFHSHPIVTSFSQPDYLLAVKEAYSHPQHRSLLCVALLNTGIRCKALKELPTKEALVKIPWGDTEENREKIKPYFTKKVTIPLDYLAKLIEGVPWEELPPAPHVVAVDEGEGPVPVAPHKPPVPVKPGVVVPAGTGLYQTLISGGSIGDFIISRQGLPKTVNACEEG